MSTGFILVLLREIRESILKLRQEFNERLDQIPTQIPSQDNDSLNEKTDYQDQALATLGRIESEVHDMRKFTRLIALNQSKHEQAHSQHIEHLENDVRELQEQIRRLKQGR